MGFLSKLIGGSAKEPIEAIGGVLDDLFTSDEERSKADFVMAKLRQEPGKLQVALNQVEAGHRSVFVAGWRPFVGWVCGFSLLYNFIIRDLIGWVLVITGSTVAPPPELAMEHLLSVLFGLLGLGTLRTVEKLKGRAK